MKEAVISTSALNSYGSRVLTDGIDTSQYEKNPVLLWMHQRGWSGDRTMPIGRMENLRRDGDKLIGTPVFDDGDDFARHVREKWENGFLKMVSAGVEILATSDEAEDLLPGQKRPTVTKSKLVEVSIVDIGANDEALQLASPAFICSSQFFERSSQASGLGIFAEAQASKPGNFAEAHQAKAVTVHSSQLDEERLNSILPLFENHSDNDNHNGNENDNHNGNENDNKNKNQKENEMNKKEICEFLGLSETASDAEVLDTLKLMKARDTQMQALELSMIESAVDDAISDKRVTLAKREHFVELGKKVGLKSLKETLDCMKAAVKPLDVIKPDGNGNRDDNGVLDLAKLTKLSEVPEDKIVEVKEKHPDDYLRLYKGEYGVGF